MKTKTKKLLGFFAFLFAVLIALAGVFGVACNKNDKTDGDDGNTPEVVEPGTSDGGNGGEGGEGGEDNEKHEHVYAADENTEWTWGTDAEGNVACTATLTCSGTVGTCDAKTKEVSADVTSEDTDPTCTEAGYTTYTATYEDKEVGTHKVDGEPALGHNYDETVEGSVVFEWGQTADGIGVATLTLSCTRCDHTWTSDATVGTATGKENEYKVTITGDDGNPYEDSHTVTDTDPVTHVHNYVLDEDANWTWSDDYTECYASATCTNEDGNCDKTSGYVYAEVEPSEPTTADCTTPSYVTYTATYGGETVKTSDPVEVSPALGHTYDESSISWVWTIDGEGKGNAKFSITCNMDDYTYEEELDQIEAVDGTYTASTTGITDAQGQPYTDTYTPVPETQKSVTVDFSDSDSYEWMTAAISATDGAIYSTWDGRLSLTSTGSSKSKMALVDSNGSVYALNTYGGSSNSNGRYFTIDFSNDKEFIGQYVTITVEIASHAADAAGRSLYVDTQYASTPSAATTTALAIATSTAKGDKNGGNATLTFVYEITGECNVFYLTCDGGVDIYSVVISVSEENTSAAKGAVSSLEIENSSDGLSMTLSGDGDVAKTLQAVVTMVESGASYTGGYKWSITSSSSTEKDSDNKGLTVIEIAVGDNGTLTVTAKNAGTATITLTLEDDLSKKAKIEVTVEKAQEAPTVDSISVDPSTLELVVGETQNVTVTVTMSDENTSMDFTVESSGTGTVEIQIIGSTVSVTAMTAGDVTITVKAGEKEETVAVAIQEAQGEDVKTEGITGTFLFDFARYVQVNGDLDGYLHDNNVMEVVYLNDDGTVSLTDEGKTILSFYALSEVDFVSNLGSFTYDGYTYSTGLKTRGQSDETNGRYFKVDLSNVAVGSAITITVMYSNSSADDDDIKCSISTELFNEETVLSSSHSYEVVDSWYIYEFETLEYTKVEGDDALYICFDGNTVIYGITITIAEAEEEKPDFTGSHLFDFAKYVQVNGDLDGYLHDNNVMEVVYLNEDGSVSLTDEGKTILSFYASGEVDFAGNLGSFTCGGYTYTTGLKTRGKSDETNGRYFKVDLSNVAVGSTITITVMYSNSGADDDDIKCSISTELFNEGTVLSSDHSYDLVDSWYIYEFETLEYTKVKGDDALYICFDGNTVIYGITITIE